MPVRRLERSKRANSGWLQLGDEHRRHAVERRAALLGDGLQRGERVEALAGEHHRRAVRDARQIADHHAEAMIERHRDAHLVALGEAHRLAEEEAVVQDVVVRQRRALRRAGGARGELDVDRVVELQPVRQFRREAARSASPPTPRTSSKREGARRPRPPIWITMRSAGSFGASSLPGRGAGQLRRQRCRACRYSRWS